MAFGPGNLVMMRKKDDQVLVLNNQLLSLDHSGRVELIKVTNGNILTIR